jgi:hypothetical protein
MGASATIVVAPAAALAAVHREIPLPGRYLELAHYFEWAAHDLADDVAALDPPFEEWTIRRTMGDIYITPEARIKLQREKNARWAEVFENMRLHHREKNARWADVISDIYP